MGVEAIKTQVEEKVVPHIPTNISESVSKNMSATLETVSAAMEKVDCYACCGIEQLTEKVPQLKEATPKLMEETKENVTSYITALTDYAASFSVAQLALKVADAGLNVVEEVLKKTGTNEESGVRKIHSTANTIRISGLNKAGTEKAKKIEEASITEAVMFMLGVTDLLAFLGFKLAKTEQIEEEAAEEEKSDK